jgi:DNA-binding transcriptional LysR family regulator
MENFRLKVFRTVADALSFRRAAEQLKLSQPAVTLQIKALEEELSARLLDRTGNRVALTDAGRILLKHARAIAEQVQASAGGIGGSDRRSRGRAQNRRLHEHCAVRSSPTS